MKKIEKTAEMLLMHFKAYPKLEIQDIFKFLYQSSFGCEHMCGQYDRVFSLLKEEQNADLPTKSPLIEELDGDYCRISTKIFKKGLATNTLAKLFMLSAKKEENGLNLLKEKLDIAKSLVLSGQLPLNSEDFLKQLSVWESKGFSPIHHSAVFKENYHPSYRVVSKTLLPFLPLFLEIDTRLQSDRLILAIEGGSASGKTTLSALLEEIYNCTVFHMDDFFLQPEQRTEKRLSTPGGNIDYERFLKEILIPLGENEAITYCPFNCSSMSLEPPITLKPERLCVIEGAYSMHPALKSNYDLSVFLDISPSLQRSRILNRNTPAFAKRFFEEWIPLEELYFKELNVKNSCDLLIEIN